MYYTTICIIVMPSDTLIHDYIAGAIGGMYMNILLNVAHCGNRTCDIGGPRRIDQLPIRAVCSSPLFTDIFSIIRYILKALTKVRFRLGGCFRLFSCRI